MSSTSTSTPKPAPKPDTHRAEQVRRIGLGALGALVVLFALVNLDDVHVDWIVFSSQTPLIVVIGVAFALGVGAGALVHRHRSRP